jgi:hypothetical protein
MSSGSNNLLPQNSRIVQPAFLEQHSNKVRLQSNRNRRYCSQTCVIKFLLLDAVLFMSCCIVLLAASLSHSHSHSLLYTPHLQKDLVKRLRALTKVLETDDDVLVDSPAWPGLAATASLLVTDAYLQHADKEVRLYTVQACMELFAIVSTICKRVCV